MYGGVFCLQVSHLLNDLSMPTSKLVYMERGVLNFTLSILNQHSLLIQWFSQPLSFDFNDRGSK